MSSSDSTPGTLPRHVAIIMDGNGRWAKNRKLPRPFGHREGVKALLQREPNHVAALSERGLLLAKLDRFDAALGDVARAVALGPREGGRAFRLQYAAQVSVEGEVLQHAEIFVEAELLGHVAEALTQQIPLAHRIQPQHPDGARFGDQQTGQQA